MFSWLTPFHPYVWFLFLGSLLASSIAYMIVGRLAGASGDGGSGGISDTSIDTSNFSETLYEIAVAATGQLGLGPTTHGSRRTFLHTQSGCRATTTGLKESCRCSV